MRRDLSVPLICVLALVPSACATLERRELTPFERQLAKCVGAAAITTGLGAAIGAAVRGGEGAKTGAIAGAATGGAVCAIMIAMKSDEDKARVSQTQAEALESGESVRDEYVGEDSKKRVVVSEVRDADVSPTPPVSASADDVAVSFTGVCRYEQTSIEVEGLERSAKLEEVLYCRTTDGDWLPYSVEAV